MSRRAAGAVYAAVMIVLIATVDVLFLRQRPWERLAVNVGIVAVSVAVYLWSRS